MFLMFFLAWIIFNGNFTLEIALFGVLFSCLLMGFICRFMDYKLSYELFLFRKFKLIAQLLAVIVLEIAKANEQLIYWIFSNKYRMEPAIVKFKVDLKTDWGKAILANCITLTPGTITALLEGDELTVHCLDKDLGEGLADCAFVRVLRKLEEK